MHTGATLRLLRLHAGVGLRELAQAIGVSPAYVSRVELGRDPTPTPDRLAGIARVLGLPAGALVGVDDDARAAPGTQELVTELTRRRLSAAQVARVVDFVRREFPLAEASGPSLAPLLEVDRVVCGVRVARLQDALDLLASRLAPPAEAAWLAERMAAREHVAPTAIGGGVALPMAPGAGAGAAPTAALLTLSPPLSTPTPDGRPLRLLVALRGLPEGPVGLELLLQAAALARPATCDELCAQARPADVLRVLGGGAAPPP